MNTKGDQQTRSSLIQWTWGRFNEVRLCLSFPIYLSEPFKSVRVFLEESDGSFHLYHEINGPFEDSWKKARFFLTQKKDLTAIWLEATVGMYELAENKQWYSSQ